MKYIEEVQKGMNLLAQNEKTLFVGQAVKYKGTALTHQVKDYPDSIKIEMPVAEDFQAGFCLGLSLEGFIPVCLYPRMNFAICAANQIVNHIDKWRKMSCDKSRPGLIIKGVVGSEYPLDPGHQHKANYAQAFRDMCEDINVVELIHNHDIVPAYQQALYDAEMGFPTFIVEHGDLYSA